ncbi:MAG: transcriptional regulator GcvA [Geminicoccaceae bacterium]
MLTRLPPLNALRAFEAAARHTSFARAADELAVTPAAISQQVRQLEEDLGVQLFRRLPRGLMLTDAGRSCLPELAKAFHHLARAVEDVRAGSIDGRLVVSVIPSFAHRWLLPRLPTFCAAYPRIDLTISADMRNVDFANEDVDIGIRYGRGVYPGLDTSLLLTETVFPVCAPVLLNGPKGIRRPEDLRHHTLLHDRQLSGQEPSLYWRQWLRDHGLADIDADRGPGFTDSTMLTEAAVRGIGVAMGRSALVAEELEAGRLVRPFPDSRPADYAYFVVTPPGRSAGRRARAFLDWLAEEAARSQATTAPDPR